MATSEYKVVHKRETAKENESGVVLVRDCMFVNYLVTNDPAAPASWVISSSSHAGCDTALFLPHFGPSGMVCLTLSEYSSVWWRTSWLQHVAE